MELNESLNPAHGWRSGRKIVPGAHDKPKSLNINKDVVAWVPGAPGVAIMHNGTQFCFCRLLDAPELGGNPVWKEMTYVGHYPFASLEQMLAWAETKKFNGLRIID